ncbi:MAG: hypothetical protein KAQ75_13255, partial [Bacteroidales bacterium]|nr:hypothetical protein [Bacteroidales bacterium]
MKKIYYILTVAFLTLCFISNTSAQLTIVKAVIVDTNDDGYADALEIKFNQPIDWSESNDEDDDW